MPARCKILAMILVLSRHLFKLNSKPGSLCATSFMSTNGSVFTAKSDLGFMRLSSLLFRVVLGKRWPTGHIWPSAYTLWIKVQWNTVMAVCLCIVYGCFWVVMAKIRCLTKPNIFTVWSFTENSSLPTPLYWVGQTIPNTSADSCLFKSL